MSLRHWIGGVVVPGCAFVASCIGIHDLRIERQIEYIDRKIKIADPTGYITMNASIASAMYAVKRDLEAERQQLKDKMWVLKYLI